jgi:hypothetical protein
MKNQGLLSKRDGSILSQEILCVNGVSFEKEKRETNAGEIPVLA